jgi:hypothetical protein
LTHKDSDALSDPEKYLRMAQERFASLILGLRRIPQPVISAVNGPAAGGGFSLALASESFSSSSLAFFLKFSSTRVFCCMVSALRSCSARSCSMSSCSCCRD